MSNASAYFTLGSINGMHDMKKIKRELNTLPGVFSVSVNESSGCVAVDFDTTGTQYDRIKKQFKKMGYEIVDSKLDDHIM